MCVRIILYIAKRIEFIIVLHLHLDDDGDSSMDDFDVNKCEGKITVQNNAICIIPQCHVQAIISALTFILLSI